MTATPPATRATASPSAGLARTGLPAVAAWRVKPATAARKLSLAWRTRSMRPPVRYRRLTHCCDAGRGKLIASLLAWTKMTTSHTCIYMSAARLWRSPNRPCVQQPYASRNYWRSSKRMRDDAATGKRRKTPKVQAQVRVQVEQKDPRRGAASDGTGLRCPAIALKRNYGPAQECEIEPHRPMADIVAVERNFRPLLPEVGTVGFTDADQTRSRELALWRLSDIVPEFGGSTCAWSDQAHVSAHDVKELRQRFQT